MKKGLFIFLYVVSINACQNEANKMSEYSTSDSIVSIQIPSYLDLTKTDTYSMQFEGKEKIAKMMITDSDNGWDMVGFTNDWVGNMRSKLTLIEQNDSIIAFEINKGITHIPAQIVSVYRRNGYSIMLATMGINLATHKAIGNSIQCISKKNSNKMSSYHGDYLSLQYPSSWIIDEHPNTLTADVWITQKDHAFGMWIFQFEKEDISFKDAMVGIANNWHEIAEVDMSYININSVEWCKHDIRMDVQGQKGRQISYYCLKGDSIYNIKFGNSLVEVEKNSSVIDSIMSSVVIK